MKKDCISPRVRGKLDAIYAFIEQYQASRHYAPSRQELADAFGTSKSVIGFYLRRMALLGMIEPLQFNISRSLTLLGTTTNKGVRWLAK